MDLSDYANAAQGRVHPVHALLLRLRRQALGRAAGHRRGPAVPPHRPGRGARPRRGRSSTSRAPPTTASPTRAPPYEGLTCNFVELSSAAGGTILSEDGSKAEFDSPENLKALQLMVDGMKSGGAVKASRTYMEEPARIAFESGKATLHAQLELRLRARQEGAEGQGQARGLAAAAVRGRRQGRRAGRQRPGRERLHRRPRGRDRVARLLDLGGDDQAQRREVRAAADDAAALRGPGASRRRCPTPRSC